jgi:NADPH-dependent curcumin reductase CurA
MGRRRNFSREDVLTKAIPVFWKRGFADKKVEDLEATGVNKSGLYSKFSSKEIFVERLKHYLRHERLAAYRAYQISRRRNGGAEKAPSELIGLLKANNFGKKIIKVSGEND